MDSIANKNGTNSLLKGHEPSLANTDNLDVIDLQADLQDILQEDIDNLPGLSSNVDDNKTNVSIDPTFSY